MVAKSLEGRGGAGRERAHGRQYSPAGVSACMATAQRCTSLFRSGRARGSERTHFIRWRPRQTPRRGVERGRRETQTGTPAETRRGWTSYPWTIKSALSCPFLCSFFVLTICPSRCFTWLQAIGPLLGRLIWIGVCRLTLQEGRCKPFDAGHGHSDAHSREAASQGAQGDPLRPLPQRLVGEESQ